MKQHIPRSRSAVSEDVAAGMESFAQAWASAVIGTSYVPMTRAEVVDHLRGLTELLVQALLADSFRTSVAHEVGIRLVEAHFTGTETLDRTIQLMGDELLAELRREGEPHLRSRIAALQGALSAGYAQSLRERTLDEQEAIREAVLDARDHAEAALRASEARFRAVFAEAAIGMGISDTDGNILEVNQSLQDMLGYPAAELRQRNLRSLMHPADAESVWGFYQQLLHGERDHFRVEKRFNRRDGEAVWTHLTISLVRDDHGRPAYQVAMVEDVTDRHLLQNRLRYQALHDPLTTLPNRALFLERLSKVFDSGHGRVGLCYLDLDGFKVINDSLGHDIGDQLLVAVANRLDESVAGEGRLVARMGGDEFVILIEDSAGEESIVDIANRVLGSLTGPVRIDGHELSVSASIGLVEREIVGTTSADLMRDADITLYWAKADGKSRWALYDPERNAREVARFTLSATMPAALERDEFYVDYQPLIRLEDSKVLGVEALVRWQHPEFGRLAPDRFIELAEETGLIVTLGRWVLRTACHQARRWLDQFGDATPFVSVNLAVRQSRDPALVSDVKAILDETELPPHLLQLELTESAVMGTADEELDALRQLNAMGVRIAIDDFGTGYSNLAYLKHLPVHELKIAGSFMEGMRAADGGDPVDAKIVGTLVSLAHALGLTVTAEGVETPSQAERLRKIGCDAGQGWLFARPGTPDQIETLF
jgi:diguanylate cyclase (GGDEF)-like protein/PAS domain S-box-containing protein